MKNVRSSLPCISINFCTELSKAQVLPCGIVKETTIMLEADSDVFVYEVIKSFRNQYNE